MPMLERGKDILKHVNSSNGKQTMRRAAIYESSWQRQGGKCLVCQQAISEESKWEKHYTLVRKAEGSDHKTNLVSLHSTCHKQWHNNEEVARSVRGIPSEQGA